MRLADYKDLINRMPVSAHAFTCSRKNWSPYFDRRRKFGRALSRIFANHDEITIARSDLRELGGQKDLDAFVVATILWGYPAGMRGTNIANISDSLPKLITLLQAVRERTITDWPAHCESLRIIEGVGLSTYTKLLAFLAAPVNGCIALILDQRIAGIAERQAFHEMTPIRGLTYDNGLRRYPEYLHWIHATARMLDVPAENLEFFLYEFGANLKDITSSPRS